MGRDEACSVFLGNLSDHARNDDIEKFFKGFGKLKDVSLKGGYGKNHFCFAVFMEKLIIRCSCNILLFGTYIIFFDIKINF